MNHCFHHCHLDSWCCYDTVVFPDTQKKSIIVPSHKKGDKQIVNNRPVSLLPVCSKILEKIIFDSITRFLNENKLLGDTQSGFRPSDSCECQLLSLVHDIYKSSFFGSLGIFLVISKAFDRVWHDGLIYKIKSFGVTNTLLKLIENFFSNRYQMVVLNGQSSSWAEVSAGVSQGPILGPLFFLMFINDLSCGLSSTTKPFAHDTSLFSVVCNVAQSTNKLNDDLKKISYWAYQWKMSFIPNKSKQAQEIVFSHKTQKVINLPAIFNNMPVVLSSCQKLLGIYLHIGILRKLYNVLPRSSLITIYKSFIQPCLNYGAIIFGQPENESFCKKSNQFNIMLYYQLQGNSRFFLRKVV